MAFKPLTGKKHQLRILSQKISCPIVGDTKYNLDKKFSSENLKLNAYYLKFTINNQEYKFKKSIIYENNDFLIIDKWSGLASQAGSKVNVSIDDIIKNISPCYNLVHRLDKDTSGLMIIGKNLIATKNISKLFN